MSVEASQVVAAIEQMSKASLKGLEDALLLVQRTETTRATEIATAEDAMGPSLAKTVVELARVTTADRTREVLEAIREAVERLLSAAPATSEQVPPASAANDAPSHVVPAPSPAQPRQRVFAPPPAAPSARGEMFGVQFPSSRREEAEDVVSQARAAVAQGHKTNPFESYRGKNQWCKKLFDTAYAALVAGADHEANSDPVDPVSIPKRASEEPRPQLPPEPPQAAQRSAVALSGPARGGPYRFGPPATPPHSGVGTTRPSPGRRFGMGVVTQTIDPDGAEPAPQARESFYKRKR